MLIVRYYFCSRAQLQDTLDISGMKRGVLADEVVEELQARGNEEI